jgi:hypothetical protein
MRPTLLLFCAAAPLAACGTKTLDISVEQRGCEGLSEDQSQTPTLVQTKEGCNYVFYRDWVYVSSTAEFDSELS